MTKKQLLPQLPEPTDEEMQRVKRLLRKIGGEHVRWGAIDVLETWRLEHRAKLDQQMNERIRVSSWALFIATVGLAICTAVLIWAALIS